MAIATRYGHHELAAWVLSTRLCSPALPHLEVLTAERARALLRVELARARSVQVHLGRQRSNPSRPTHTFGAFGPYTRTASPRSGAKSSGRVIALRAPCAFM